DDVSKQIARLRGEIRIGLQYGEACRNLLPASRHFLGAWRLQAETALRVGVDQEPEMIPPRRCKLGILERQDALRRRQRSGPKRIARHRNHIALRPLGHFGYERV